MTGSGADGVRRAPRRDATENRGRLVQAASDVFGEHGTEVSLELVASEAGLGPATLHRHFASKAELVAGLVTEVLSYLVQVAEEELAAGDGAGLERWLAVCADVQARKRGFAARLWDDAGLSGLRADLEFLLGELLTTAQEAGRIRPEAVPGDVLLTVHALRGVAAAVPFGDADAWRRHLAIVLAGLRPDAGPMAGPAPAGHRDK